MGNVALLGLGTVGTGVAELLDKNAAIIAQKAGRPVELKYILVRRDRPDCPWREKLIQDFELVENDPEIIVVVECMGGVGAAYDYVRRALEAGKHVITSNKELIAEHGYELLSLAKKNNLNLLFEASVGGGVPILRPINTCLAANELTEVCGIINGTTNYILTKMLQEDLSYDQALAQAAALGYAEADPSADVDGHDACRKICILAALAFGRHIYPRQVPTMGITGVHRMDTVLAQLAGYRVKLLARARRQADGKICIYVAPHLVPESRLLARVDDVFNGIVVRGDAIGDALFYGRGAGKLPTASAVIADVIDALQHLSARRPVDWNEGGEDAVADARKVPMRWFVRMQGTQAPPELGHVETIRSMENDQIGLITGPMTWNDFTALRASGLPILTLLPLWEA